MAYMGGQVLDKYMENAVLRQDLEYLLRKFDSIVRDGIRGEDRLGLESLIHNYYSFYNIERD